MSLSLPHHLVQALNFLGFGWPEIDEDGLREAAGHLRTYARDLNQSVDSCHQRITVDLGHVYDAASYRGLVDVWVNETRGHLDTMVEGSLLMAGGLEVAADGVVAMKLAVIAQLEIALAEFLADQAAAVFTLGLAEMALPTVILVQNRILNAIVSECEAELMEQLLVRTLRPVRDRIKEAAHKLMYPEMASYSDGSRGMNVDTDGMRMHAAALAAEAEGARVAGARLSANIDAVSFTQGD